MHRDMENLLENPAAADQFPVRKAMEFPEVVSFLSLQESTSQLCVPRGITSSPVLQPFSLLSTAGIRTTFHLGVAR